MVFPSDPSPRIRQEGFLSHILVRIRCCNANQMVYVMGTRAGVRVRPRAAGTEGLLPPNLPEWVAVGLPRGGAGFVHSRFSSPGSVGLVSHPPGVLGAAALGVQAQRLPKAASAQRSREFQLRAPGAGPGRGGALPLPVCDQKPPRERRGQRPDPESRLDDLPNFSLPSEPQRRRGLRKRGGPARPRQQVGDLADANPNNAAELPGHSHRRKRVSSGYAKLVERSSHFCGSLEEPGNVDEEENAGPGQAERGSVQEMQPERSLASTQPRCPEPR
ncbi:MRN complex-interacting protein isoform X4 [Phoca vitulina]|uniref:MRN complex-interacting protein isoform X4 n=1 Tax=Phoca vitulina TaxID=9720 RepID=UPI00139658AA|nr:MRN complex-interacting protein isoform X4 [Phoca vitulina]